MFWQFIGFYLITKTASWRYDISLRMLSNFNTWRENLLPDGIHTEPTEYHLQEEE